MSLSQQPDSDDSAEAARCRRWFWAWLTARTLAWSLVAAFTQLNGPKDLLEMLGWGREWQWGYYKHPPLPAWLADACFRLAGGSLLGPDLGSYALIGLSFWAVWRLALVALPPRAALVSVIALEGVHFYGISAGALNHNVALAATSALTALFCFNAAQSGRLRDWTLAGLAAGTALLAKYNAVYLFAAIAGYLICYPPARRVWRTPGPYLAAILAGLVFAPHLIWAVQHDFPTLRYAMERTAANGSPWLARVREPVNFTLWQLAAVAPLLLLLVWSRPRRLDTPEASAARAYLVAVGLGPFLLYLLTGLLGGTYLHGPWGMPLWLMLGAVVLLARSTWPGRPVSGLVACGGLAACGVFLVAFAVHNLYVPHLTRGPTRIHFPGRELAHAVEQRWTQQFGTPLPMAAGDWWLAANVGCYGSERPRLYVAVDRDGDFLPEPEVSNGSTDAELLRRGGVLLWRANWGPKLPAELRARFPTAIAQPMLVLPQPEHYPWPRPRVGFAIVPPATEASKS